MLFVSFSRLNDGNVFHQTFCSLWNVVAIHLAGTEIDGTIYVIIECYRFSFHIFTNGSVSQTSNKQWFWTMFPIAIETRLFTIPRCPKIDWMDFSNWNNTLSSIRSCQKSGFCGFKKKLLVPIVNYFWYMSLHFVELLNFLFKSECQLAVLLLLLCWPLFKYFVLPWDRNMFDSSQEKKKTRYETKSQSKF